MSKPKPTPPESYAEWLTMSDDQRFDMKMFGWKAHEREGIAFPFMAAARLAMQCPFKVLDISVGNSLGNTHDLLMTIHHRDYRSHSPLLKEFEGFEVVWIAREFGQTDSWEHSPPEGKWKPVDSWKDYEFDFTPTAAGIEVAGRCAKTDEVLHISDVVLAHNKYVLFSAYSLANETTSTHAFSLLSSDRCKDDVTREEQYLRVSQTE